MSVEATIVVEFGQGVDSGALVVVELDEEMNLDLDGEEKTTFFPEDTPYFLVHHDASVRIGAVRSSSGMVSGGGVVSRERSQQMQWPTADDQQDLPHIPASEPTWKWWGNMPVISRDGRAVTASGSSLPAIGEVSYTIETHQYQLFPPAMDLEEEETYPVLVVITMEAA